MNIALPSAQADLGFGDGHRQWIVTAYALAFGSLLLLGGRVGDLVGRKRIFLIALVTTFSDPRERGKAFGVFGTVAAGRVEVGLGVGDPSARARPVQGELVDAWRDEPRGDAVLHDVATTVIPRLRRTTAPTPLAAT